MSSTEFKNYPRSKVSNLLLIQADLEDQIDLAQNRMSELGKLGINYKD